MGRLKGGQIDESITIQTSIMSYNTQITKRSLEEGSLQSPHWWLAQRVPPHLVQQLLFFFQGVLEAPTRSASQSTTELEGECLLIGGFLALAIWVSQGQDREVCQVRLHPNRLITCQQIVILAGDGARQKWANTIVIHLHVLGLVLSWRGIRGWSRWSRGAL